MGSSLNLLNYLRGGEHPLDWQDEGLCNQTDPDAFFPEVGEDLEYVKKVCAACDVRKECLQYAFSNHERYGIWGGLNSKQREAFRRSGKKVTLENVDAAIQATRKVEKKKSTRGKTRWVKVEDYVA